MVFRSRILICFQKPQDLLQKSDANEDDDEDDDDEVRDSAVVVLPSRSGGDRQ